MIISLQSIAIFQCLFTINKDSSINLLKTNTKDQKLLKIMLSFKRQTNISLEVDIAQKELVCSNRFNSKILCYASLIQISQTILQSTVSQMVSVKQYEQCMKTLLISQYCNNICINLSRMSNPSLSREIASQIGLSKDKYNQSHTQQNKKGFQPVMDLDLESSIQMELSSSKRNRILSVFGVIIIVITAAIMMGFLLVMININSKVQALNNRKVRPQKSKDLQITTLNSKIASLNDLIVKSSKQKQSQRTKLDSKVKNLKDLIIESNKNKQIQRNKLNQQIKVFNQQLLSIKNQQKRINQNLISELQMNVFTKIQKERQVAILTQKQQILKDKLNLYESELQMLRNGQINVNDQITKPQQFIPYNNQLDQKLIRSENEVKRLNQQVKMLNNKLANAEKKLKKVNKAQSYLSDKIIKQQEEKNELKNKLSKTQKELQNINAPPKFKDINHKNSSPKFEYPTVGVPKPGNAYNSTPVKQENFPQFDKVVNEVFQPYNNTDCEYARYGNDDDGGIVLCKNFISKSEALINIGINSYGDKFGCQLTSAFKIPNYLYECDNAKQPQCSTNDNRNIFSQICVNDQKEYINGFVFYTLKDIIKNRGLSKKHITLKMNNEGGEYAAFKYFPMEDLDFIDQILLEVHFQGVFPEYWGHLDIFRSLGEKFVPVNYHANNHACITHRPIKSKAYEITLVNKKIINLKSNSRSFVLHSTNRKNYKNGNDCSLP